MTGVDIGNPMLGAPWQNRPSLIACWEHAQYGQDITGLPVLGISLTMDGGATPQIPVCIPRACRLTRVCAHYYYSDTSIENDFTLDISRSQTCLADGPTLSQTLIPLGVGGFAPNCFCTDVNIVFDECDLWFAAITIPGASVTFPLFRVIFHFELR